MTGLPFLIHPEACDSPYTAGTLIEYADRVRVVRVATESAGSRSAAPTTLYGGDDGAPADVYDRPKSLMESPAGDEGRAGNALVYLPGGVGALAEDPDGARLEWVTDAHGHAVGRVGTVVGIRPDDALVVHFREGR